MLVYLDSAQNRKGQPNENFAREVMELFTRGRRQIHARRTSRKPRARSRAGASIAKPASTCSGRARTTTATRPCSANRADSTAMRCSTSCSRNPPPRSSSPPSSGASSSRPTPTRARSSASRRHSGVELRHQDRAARRAAERRVLGARRIAARWSRAPSNSSSGRCASWKFRRRNGLPFAVLAAGMGQNLFSPPNVKGWPGGNAWINANTLLARKQFVDRLARADEGSQSHDRGRGAATSPSVEPSRAPTPLFVADDQKGALPAVGARSRSRLAQRQLRRGGVARRAQGSHARRQGACGASVAARVAAASATTIRRRRARASSARRCRTPSIS